MYVRKSFTSKHYIFADVTLFFSQSNYRTLSTGVIKGEERYAKLDCGRYPILHPIKTDRYLSVRRSFNRNIFFKV